MTLKNVKYSSDSSQSTLRDLKDGECGGCGTFDNVTDNCCEECGEGYPDPSEQDVLDANDYYEHHVKPPHISPEPEGTGKTSTNPDLKGLNKWIGEGGLKRGELNIIGSHNPFKR